MSRAIFSRWSSGSTAHGHPAIRHRQRPGTRPRGEPLQRLRYRTHVRNNTRRRRQSTLFDPTVNQTRAVENPSPPRGKRRDAGVPDSPRRAPQGVGRIAKGVAASPACHRELLKKCVSADPKERPADGSTHWSTRSMAAQVGIGKDWWPRSGPITTSSRGRSRHSRSATILGRGEIVDVVGLYLNRQPGRWCSASMRRPGPPRTRNAKPHHSQTRH